MPDYISIAVEVDASTIKQELIDKFEDLVPGVVIRPGHPINFIFEADALQHAQNRQLITEVTDLIWDTFGAKILQVTRFAATQATGAVTMTRINTTAFPLSSPLTVDEGTELTLRGANGDRIRFQTRNEVTFAAADATTDVGEIEIIAVDPGPDGNDLQADPQLEEPVAWFGSMVVVAPTSGGDEGETDVLYRNRLRGVTRLMTRTLGTPLPLGEDFALDARVNTPEVARALPLDTYNPDTGMFGDGGYMALAVINDAGLDPGGTVRTNGEARQQALAVSGLIVNWITAAYTAVAVVFAAKCYPQFDPADVEARAEQAVLDLLSPARWGLPPFGDEPLWLPVSIVRYRDVVAAIENVEGLDYTTAVTVNAGTADVTLPGVAPLPSTASTAAGTVTSP